MTYKEHCYFNEVCAATIRPLVKFMNSPEIKERHTLLNIFIIFTNTLGDSFFGICLSMFNYYLHKINHLDFKLHIYNIISRKPFCKLVTWQGARA